jgi:flagellar basal body P-ring formation protein FlgA
MPRTASRSGVICSTWRPAPRPRLLAMRRHRLSLFPVLLLACSALPLHAHAREAWAPLVEATATRHAAGLPGDVQVTLGPQVARLPACATPEAFMPPGSKPWGELLVGVRCESGAAWTRFVGVQVSVVVRHAVASKALPAGHKMSPDDIGWARADLARLPAGVVLDEALLAGALTVHPLASGAPLRRDLLKAQPVIRQGQVVKVHTLGPGFSLSAEGKAQAHAAPGQSLAIRMPGGQVITAVARADGSAEKGL